MENNQEPVTQTEEKTEVTVTQTENAEEKTFTQEEVNSMLAKERKKMPSKDELKEFNDWKESKKTEAEKNAEILEENKNLKTRVSELENLQVVANAGVDSKFQKFVLSEVIGMEGEFETNLTTYLKTNNQYLVEKQKENKSTGVNQNKSNLGVSEEKAYLDKKYANNPYYKK